ncbi:MULTISPECIES: MFS transporter [Paenarthrobacter]|uniref:MHS family MFS transporter n=1 Tax=Paenarthrobacter ureafaciens TaxID=37931 RepID=A0AAX3EK73_PAEUR|nr:MULTISPECIES: MFS transporter [Paenarthrobacter]NKR12373.1 MFS transporter [Arthrobacter sp. M5]NKR14204.1 MFS transporter [Arthrobacter sp. M6]OEH61349.1 MFS transporter [Arthrobacter sp. D2]OEH64221.1 MFS transporter [Arthrobacter sp. D4]MDO5863304.1 MHS family MFS transporter [Paenarthrobacter sp. SD-2]
MASTVSPDTDTNPAAGHVVDERVTKKVALAALVGTALEWYDFFLFTTAAALVFNAQFFVSQDPFVAAMGSFATLAVGFVARPVGGFIFGALGDKVGRKKILMVTIVGIGIVTGLIGLLPNYMSIGIAAPILLVALRIVQGLAVGGEWSGAVIIAVENAPVEKRARYAALPQIGSPIGTILSSGGFFGMLFLVGQTNFDSWGWRIPFVAAIPLLAISLWIRSRLSESPEFEALMESGETEHAPIRGVLKNSWRQILVGMCSALLGIGGFYLITSFVVFYGTKVLKMPSELLLLGTLLAAALEIGALVWAGRLGEKFGASKVILWGGVASALIAVPVFLAIDSRVPVLVVLAMMIGVAVLSIPYAVSGTALTALFATKVRYTGVAITSNTAGVISGFVPLIATALVAANSSFWPGAIILLVISALTALSGLFLPKLSIAEKGMKH